MALQALALQLRAIDKDLMVMQREAARTEANVVRVKELESMVVDLKRQLEEKKTALKAVESVSPIILK